MNIEDALGGIRQLAIDTAPLIYFIERHPDYFDRPLFIKPESPQPTLIC
ncbi:MAG: hypothetical protein RLP44_10505 [Aggregatilineales bacterium]